MSGNKQSYDLICSLGGNCAAAHNLLYKGLRTVAFPFDWTYFNSDEAVYRLSEGFKDDFKNYALKKNLKELPINPSHSDKIQYEDCYGKIIWANHFLYDEDRDLGYQRVKEIIDKRFRRLVTSVKKSKKILFIFSVSFCIKPDSFIYLASALNKIYPNKNISIRVLCFDAINDSIYENNNIQICYYQRKINNQDFITTNEEWDFLDNLKIKNVILYNIKSKVLRLLIKLIPYKPLRKKLRKKYHV